jgi:hypothetical protein
VTSVFKQALTAAVRPEGGREVQDHAVNGVPAVKSEVTALQVFELATTAAVRPEGDRMY